MQAAIPLGSAGELAGSVTGQVQLQGVKAAASDRAHATGKGLNARSSSHGIIAR